MDNQNIQIVKSSTLIQLEESVSYILERFKEMEQHGKTELPIPLTDEVCQKHFNFDLITLKRKEKKGEGVIKIYGKGKTQYMFPSDVALYVRSLGCRNGNSKPLKKN